MDTIQILKILKKAMGPNFVGVFPSDQLPEPTKQKPFGMVVNLDPSTKPGSHWVAIYVSEFNVPEYFDSYGFPPQIPSIKKFLSRFPTKKYNKKQVQGPLSSVCGHYCVYYLIQRHQKKSMVDILSGFGGDLIQNDDAVTDWVNEYFDLDTETYELEYIVNQLCHAMNG